MNCASCDLRVSKKGAVPMPASVIVVHQETDAREQILAALQSAAHPAVGFSDPMAALDHIEEDTRIRVLVTRVDFGQGILNGVALARMARYKRRDVKAVFVGRREMRDM